VRGDADLGVVAQRFQRAALPRFRGEEVAAQRQELLVRRWVICEPVRGRIDRAALRRLNKIGTPGSAALSSATLGSRFPAVFPPVTPNVICCAVIGPMVVMTP
jgi:hypothetical protein